MYGVDWQLASRKPHVRKELRRRGTIVCVGRVSHFVKVASTINILSLFRLKTAIKELTTIYPLTLMCLCHQRSFYLTFANGDTKVNIRNVDMYRGPIDYRNANKIKYHTYQLQYERVFRVAMRVVHP